MTVPNWITIARSYIGTHEGVGAADNPKVVELYKLAGHPEIKHDSVAWCAAFVGACLAKAGLRNSGSLMARSYEHFGIRLKAPVYGCIGVKKRLEGHRDTGLGHVGFVVGMNEYRVYLLAGNQNDQVSIASFPKEDFVAFVWPADARMVDLPALPQSMIAANNVSES